MDTGGIWAFTSTINEFELVNGLEDLRHVNHNLLGSITVGQNIEQIVLSDEIESWESTTLGIHEVEQSLFTNR